MINHIEEAYQENTLEEANSKGKLIAWIKMHKKQLALAGVGCTATLILVILGLKNKEASADSSSILEDVDYDLTDETALLDENGADGTTQSEVMDTASPGEAVLTGASDFAAQAKISREQVRSQNKADLQDIINNEEIDDEEKQEAIHTMVSMTDLSEKEAAAEVLLQIL